MPRVENWQAIFRQSIEDASTTPFKYGVFDCCLFACEIVRRITGTNLAQPFIGKYTDKASADRALKDYAGGTLELACVKRMAEVGLPEVYPEHAAPGDLVLILTKIGPSLGIVALEGQHSYHTSHTGLIRLGRRFWARAWRI